MEDSGEVSWDNKYGGAKILLADLTGEAKYIKEADDFCLKIVNKRPRTDQNMFFIQKWGSARHAANVAYACMTLNKYVPNGITNYNSFGKEQIDLLLGDAGRSFVVGIWKQSSTISAPRRIIMSKRYYPNV